MAWPIERDMMFRSPVGHVLPRRMADCDVGREADSMLDQVVFHVIFNSCAGVVAL